MGAWGTAIFSDDEACDVRREYNVLATYIEDDDWILTKLKEFFEVKEDLNDMDAVFWYALATQQCKYGRLCDEVKENALECIKREYTVHGWYNPKDEKKRQAVLDKLKKQLESEPVPRKKISKPKRERAIWRENDVVAYHLVNIFENEYRKPSDYWFYGKYILLKIVRVDKKPISHIMPELACDEWMYCSVYDWIGDSIPDMDIVKDLNFHPFKYNEYRKEYDYGAYIYSTVINPAYKRKHDTVVIGNDTSGKLPPRLRQNMELCADVIEFLLSKTPKFTPEEIGFFNKNGMP